MTLRQQVELLQQKIDEQNDEKKKMQEQLSKSDTSHKDIDDSVIKMRENEHLVIQLTQQLSDCKETNKELSSKLVDVRRQLKSIEDQHSKLKGTYKPRLDETKIHQTDILNQVKKLKEDSAMLPEMFRELVANNESLKSTMQTALDERDQAVKDDKRLKKKVADLESELDRKKRLALQAIAARSNIKIEFEESQKKNAALQKEIQQLNDVIIDCKSERDRYSQKHDEMFSSVSNLNARIEELESHKMHLLNKLKKYGDKGGLEYIIQT